MEHIQKNLDRISGLFGVTETIHAWCYDENGTLLLSNCPEESILNSAFDLVLCKYRMLEHYQDHDSPYIAALPFGLVWLTALAKDALGNRRIYALGPVFSNQVTYDQIQQGLFHCTTKSPGMVSINQLAETMQILPTLPSLLIQRYVLMLHYLLTGENLQISDISINNKFNPAGAQKWLKNKDRHKTWLTEQALMQAVRDGNLNFKQVLANAQGISKGVPVTSTTDPLRSGKTSAAVFISLCARAAIEGGLSPEEAYSLGDYYIQNAENCRDYSEIMGCNHDMYMDFIQRVHRKKANPNYSPQIQSCCDYIDFHVEEKMRIKTLADRIGYSEYYLSKKFKQETGMTVNEYIRNAKIERAKLLLSTSNHDIDEISEMLHFSSRGYFGEVFLQITGTTPAAYRQENKRI